MAGDEGVGLLLEESAAIMGRLRAPGGCPWDREQTPETLRKYTLEETYEVLDAIERQDWPHLEEELGDLMLQVLFYAQIASEAGHFSLAGVLGGLNRKLVRRHPHVFGVEAAAAAGGLPVELGGLPAEAGGGIETAAVVANWQSIKAKEKAAKLDLQPAGASRSGTAQAGERGGYLGEVLRGQGALSEAAKLGSAAAKVGFDWASATGLLEKIREEATEVEVELALLDGSTGEVSVKRRSLAGAGPEADSETNSGANSGVAGLEADLVGGRAGGGLKGEAGLEAVADVGLKPGLETGVEPGVGSGVGSALETAPDRPGCGRLGEEVGDLLFTAANLARHLKVDPELALRDANAKFRRRFRAMEQGSEQALEALSAEELEQAWARVKEAEGRA